MRMNYSDWTKIIYIVLSVCITCTIGWCMIRATSSATRISDVSLEHLNTYEAELHDWDIKKYDQETVMGSEVLNLIKKELSDYGISETSNFYIRVVTAKGDYTYQNAQHIMLLKDISSARYIKPTAKFTANVIRNTNKVMVGIVFTFQ